VAHPITGAEIAAEIHRVLATKGLAADPAIADQRLFPPCPTTLAIRPRGSAGWATVSVECPEAEGWPINVRTRARPAAPGAIVAVPQAGGGDDDHANPNAMAPAQVVILATSLRPGALVTAADIELADSTQSLATGLFSDPAQVIGRRMRMPLGQGQVLRSRHLDIDWTVQEGSAVMIVNRTASIEILTVGRVLENGQTGDVIEVENAASGQTLTAVVISKEKVRPIANIPRQ
jgi:flagella basal body P-ring formation protein FlgA